MPPCCHLQGPHTMQKALLLVGFLYILSIQKFFIHQKVFLVPFLSVLEDGGVGREGKGREELR